ncbi:MAG: hypothetical protein ACK56I_28285, partial [bacterium]
YFYRLIESYTLWISATLLQKNFRARGHVKGLTPRIGKLSFMGEWKRFPYIDRKNRPVWTMEKQQGNQSAPS